MVRGRVWSQRLDTGGYRLVLLRRPSSSRAWVARGATAGARVTRVGCIALNHEARLHGESACRWHAGRDDAIRAGRAATLSVHMARISFRLNLRAMWCSPRACVVAGVGATCIDSSRGLVARDYQWTRAGSHAIRLAGRGAIV